MLPIKVLLTEKEIRQDFLFDLRRRQIPEKFFYWLPTSITAWLKLCGSNHYRNYDRSISIIQQHAHEIIDPIDAESAGWISLGCGQGDKEPYFLELLKERGTDLSYRPVDASMPLLELACQNGKDVGIETIGVKADFARPEHLREIVATVPPGCRVFSLLGNTVGVSQPPGVLPQLREVITADDFLIVDAELFAENRTLAGYDNPDNLAFAMAPLRGLGFSESDGRLTFDLVTEEGDGLYYIRKSYRFERDVQLHTMGEKIQFKAGERFVMSRSYKYSQDRFVQMLEETGFQVVQSWKSDNESFILVLARCG